MLKNVLAFIAVRNIEDGVRWYKMLLGRQPDTLPMRGLAEWKFEGGGWLQVNEERQLAGRSSITLVDTNIEDRITQLRKCGIDPKSVKRGHEVSVAIITDPDGNQVVFAQGKSEKHKAAM
jgi:hypothetical protein